MVWDNFKDDPNILAAKIDEFVGISLHKALFKDNAKKGSRISDKNTSAQNNNRISKRNRKIYRNLRRRYPYARC